MRNYIYILLLFTLLCFYLINSSLVITSIINYTELFITKLFPASFIFFIISYLLLDYNLVFYINRLFRVNGAVFYVLILSLISGFPSGSKYIVDLYKRGIITDKLSNYLLMFTHFPNPIFILGSVSILFNNKLYPIYILIVLIISNFIIGFLFRPKTIEKINYECNNTTFSNSLSKAVISSFKIILLIYGTSIFFYLIITIISKYISFSNYSFIFVNGIFDLINGIFLTSLINNDFIKALFIIFFISFGGISVNMQVKSIISDTSVSYKYFIIGRMLQFIISIVLLSTIVYWSNYIN
ncbi:MAG: hypothetical protein IKG58_04495 [Bacilli bacterium]|nr:hypothetical protein [Bacilli bacterium]